MHGSLRRAALLLASFVLVFLWTPITNTGDAVFVPPGSSEAHPLLHVPIAPGAAPSTPRDANALVNDAAEEAWRTLVPWQILSREKLIHGVLPVWNGSNGGGQPHLANPSTASLSPFSLPVYVLGLKYGSLVSAFARLFLLGWFAFLFLRELRLSLVAGVVGATIFMFAGHATVGLMQPGSGAAVLLPAGLFLVERLIRASERNESHAGDAGGSDASTSVLRPALWLALALALGWLAGSVETFTVAVATILAWVATRLVVVAVRGSSRALGSVARATSAIGLAFVLGALACGIQAVPWLEFARHASEAVDQGWRGPPTFTVFAWPLQVFPHLLGAPVTSGASSGFALAPDLPRPGYSEVTACYVGGLALFLAACGLVLARKRFETWFFAVVVLVWFACAHGLLASRDALAALPAWVVDPVQHLGVAYAFGIAMLAALAVDRLAARDRAASSGAAFVAAAGGLAFLALSRLAAERLLVATLLARENPDERIPAHLAFDAHVEVLGGWILLGVMAVALALATRSVTWRARAGFLIALACFLSTGWLMRDANSMTDETRLYPRTELVKQFASATSGRNVLWLGESGLPAATNVAYPLRSQAVPGPLRIRRHDLLQRALFDPRGPERVVTSTTEHALQVFGIEVVMDPDRWLDVDTEFGAWPAREELCRDTDEILPTSPVSQRFAAFRDRPQAMQLWFRTRGGRNAFTLVVSLEDARTRERFFERRFAPGEIRPRGELYAPVAFPLPAEEIAAGRTIVLRVEAPDALPGTGWSLRWRTDADDRLRELCARGVPDVDAPEGRRVLRADLWQASQSGRKLDGQLVMDLHHAYGAFAQETRIGPYNVCGHKNWSARFRTVGTAVVRADAQASYANVIDPAFDARAAVVLEAVDPAVARGTLDTAVIEDDTLVDVLDDVDGHARIVVKRKTPGFLVAPIAWYPGWTAEVNKEPAAVMCANFAFTAVAVPAGESLVDFDYRPRSVRRGTILSLLGVAGIALGFAFTNASRRRERRGRGEPASSGAAGARGAR